MTHDSTSAFARNSDSSPIDVMKKQLELLTSLSWVQRWLHNRSATAQKRPKSVVVCETYGSKMSLGDVALMGKAITSFQPCEFQKRLSCVVWNSVV